MIDAQGADLGARIQAQGAELGRRIEALTGSVDRLNARLDVHIGDHRDTG
jgi:hypothetical protein